MNHFDTDIYRKQNGIYRLSDMSPIRKGHVVIELKDVKTGKIIRDEYDNLFVTTGRNAIAERARGGDTGKITYCAVGTGTNVPSASDTTLQTEVFRKLIASRTRSGYVVTFKAFYNTSEANAALKEAGLFGDDATGTTDSGTLFARVNINRTKNSSQTLTISWDVTF